MAIESPAGPLVLIVEKEPSIAWIIARMLRAAGYRTLTAPDAPAARKILAEAQPCLITLDLSLPGVSGATFLRQLRAMPRGTDVAVLLITAQEQIQPEVRALANNLLIKPFGMEELLQTVRATLAERAAPRAGVIRQPVCSA